MMDHSQAAKDVLVERQRQVDVEGWTADHDDTHASGELATAAACYALASYGHPRRVEAFWPFEQDWFRPSSRRRNLVKAAALILAEIERLDRAARATAEARGDYGYYEN